MLLLNNFFHGGSAPPSPRSPRSSPPTHQLAVQSSWSQPCRLLRDCNQNRPSWSGKCSPTPVRHLFVSGHGTYLTGLSEFQSQSGKKSHSSTHEKPAVQPERPASSPVVHSWHQRVKKEHSQTSPAECPHVRATSVWYISLS